MRIEVRALNQVGISRFASWLADPVGRPPKEILEEDASTDVIEGEFKIDMSRRFATSYELGEYLVSDVFKGEGDRFALLANNGMWSWISLALIDSLLRKSGANAGKPLAAPHYIHSPRLAYRLIVRTAWDLFSLHGEVARVALGSKLSPWGEMAEQMTARQEIYAHTSFWPVAEILYSLPDGSVKRGTTSQRSKEARRDPNSKSGLGGVRRLPFTFRQFERTFNLRRMAGEQIVSLLPGEYQRWRANP